MPDCKSYAQAEDDAMDEYRAQQRDIYGPHHRRGFAIGDGPVDEDRAGD